MRIFAIVLGSLFVLIGLIGGFAGVVTLGINDNTGDSWSCTNTADGTSSSVSDCSFDSDVNPNQASQDETAGLGVIVGAAAFFVGGCALLGGAAAAGRKQQQPTYPPQPVAVGGPPSYGGYQGGQPGGGYQGGQPGGGDPSTRS